MFRICPTSNHIMILVGEGLIVMFNEQHIYNSNSFVVIFMNFLLDVVATCSQGDVFGGRSGRIYSFWKSLYQKQLSLG